MLTQLNDLFGLPLDTQLEIDKDIATDFPTLAKADYIEAAGEENPKIRTAQQVVEKAQAEVSASKTAYIPDVAAFVRHSYQEGVPFLVRNFGKFWHQPGLYAVGLRQAPGMQDIRDQYKKKGCSYDRFLCNNYQYTQLRTTDNLTGQIVGSFCVKFTPIGNGRVLVSAQNSFSTESGSRLPEFPGSVQTERTPQLLICFAEEHL